MTTPRTEGEGLLPCPWGCVPEKMEHPGYGPATIRCSHTGWMTEKEWNRRTPPAISERERVLEEAARVCERRHDTFVAGSPEADAFMAGAIASGDVCANRIRSLITTHTTSKEDGRG